MELGGDTSTNNAYIQKSNGEQLDSLQLKSATTNTVHIYANGDITASGNISASGDLTVQDIYVDQGGKIYLDGDDVSTPNTYIYKNSNALDIQVLGHQKMQFGNSTTKLLNSEVEIGAAAGLQSLKVHGNITASGEISSSAEIYSKTKQYWSTTGRVIVGNNTTNYYGPNPQGVNYYYWNRDLGTSSTTITSKTNTLNSGFKLPYKAVLTGYHLNIQGRSTNDNISFTLVYCDGMFDGNVTSTSQTLVEAEGAQTVTITTQNNFYELDRRGQLSIPVGAMTMLYPRFKKTSATAGTTGYDFQLAVEYYVVE